VRQGSALPSATDKTWGCAPRSASGLKGEARTGGEAALLRHSHGEAQPRRTSGGEAVMGI